MAQLLAGVEPQQISLFASFEVGNDLRSTIPRFEPEWLHQPPAGR